MKKLLIITLLFAFGQVAHAAVIDFNDGSNGAVITNQYSGLGVNFSNARYDNFISPNEASVGSSGLKLVGNGGGGDSIYSPKERNPIILTFDFGLSDFSIRSLNVGANGARIEAFDSQLGGTLVGFDESFGLGLGVDNHPLLNISALSIFRIVLFTPLSIQTEGMLWDNISFTPAATNAVPIPAAVWLFGSALAGLMGVSRKKKQALTA